MFHPPWNRDPVPDGRALGPKVLAGPLQWLQVLQRRMLRNGPEALLVELLYHEILGFA